MSSAMSAYERSRTWRSTTATRWRGGNDRTALQSGSSASNGPRSVVTVSGRSSLGTARRARSTVMIDRLAGGDRQDPPVEFRAVGESPVGLERRQERLLEDVVGVLGTHRDHQEAVHRRPVRLQERLERGDRTSPRSRPIAHRSPSSSCDPSRPPSLVNNAWGTRDVKWNREAVPSTWPSASIKSDGCSLSKTRSIQRRRAPGSPVWCASTVATGWSSPRPMATPTGRTPSPTPSRPCSRRRAPRRGSPRSP